MVIVIPEYYSFSVWSIVRESLTFFFYVGKCHTWYAYLFANLEIKRIVNNFVDHSFNCIFTFFVTFSVEIY